MQINNSNNDKNNSKDILRNSFINKKNLILDFNNNKKNDIKQKIKIKFNDNALTQINTIQININNKKEHKNNINIFTSKFNKDKLIINNQIEFYIKNNSTKIQFDTEEQIVEYIKKIYDNEKLKKIFIIEDKDISINTENKKNEFMTMEMEIESKRKINNFYLKLIN